MDKNMKELLETLAAKLGTTVDHIWVILLKQAPISALSSLLFIIIVYALGAVLYKLHLRFIKETEESYSAYDDNEGLIVIMILATGGWGALFMYHFISWQNMINGFFNPEYWALMEILDSIK